MLQISRALQSSIERRIGRLEDLYAECFNDGADYRTLIEINGKIKTLKSKLLNTSTSHSVIMGSQKSTG